MTTGSVKFWMIEARIRARHARTQVLIDRVSKPGPKDDHDQILTIHEQVIVLLAEGQDDLLALVEART